MELLFQSSSHHGCCHVLASFKLGNLGRVMSKGKKREKEGILGKTRTRFKGLNEEILGTQSAPPRRPMQKFQNLRAYIGNK